MFLTIKLCTHLFELFEIELFICIKIDLALNNLQMWICHKPQTNNNNLIVLMCMNHITNGHLHKK